MLSLRLWVLIEFYGILFSGESFIACPLCLLMPVKPGKYKNTNGSEDVFTLFFID